MDFSQLRAFLNLRGLPAYRERQVYAQVTRGLASSYDEMTDLPAGLRRELAAELPLRELTESERQHSADGTVKLRFATSDGFPVEAVAMAHGERRTVCVSSQSGCPLACTFCATGAMGLGRNLSAAEIFEQVLVLARILRDEGRKVSNVVMMGMGEPFLNYDAVLEACRLLNDPDGFGLGARRIAISTAGWVPGIERLAEEPLQVKLALSLHAPTDELRRELMPVTRRFPIDRLLKACRDYRARTGRRVFVEYLLLDGVNDSDQHAHQLAGLLGGEGFHVNLIAYNPTDAGYRASPPDRVSAFAAERGRAGLEASYRRSHGADIQAACGQLAVRGARELRRSRRRAAARR